MRKVQLHPVPTLALSCHDLECLRLIILAHITHTRRTSRPTGERQEHLAVLDALYTRLASVPASVSDIAFFLSIAEVAALCGAIRGFCTYIRGKVPPSQKREDTIRGVEQMREVLLQML